MQKMRVQSLVREDPLEKEMALQYSGLENPTVRGAWQAQPMGLQESDMTKQLNNNKFPVIFKENMYSNIIR